MTRPGHAMTRPGHAITRPAHVITRPGHPAARPLKRAAVQPLKFGARPQMPNHPDFPDDFGSYEDDLPLDDPSSGLKYKYA